MRTSVPVRLLAFACGVSAIAGDPAPSALAHEEHRTVCSETSLNALRADIQALNDGATKKAASDEMAMAQDMLAKINLHACAEHMQKAEEAMSK